MFSLKHFNDTANKLPHLRISFRTFENCNDFSNYATLLWEKLETLCFWL